MENITVIMPIHIYDDTVKKYMNEAIISVITQTEPVEELMIVGPQEVLNEVKNNFNDIEGIIKGQTSSI